MHVTPPLGRFFRARYVYLHSWNSVGAAENGRRCKHLAERERERERELSGDVWFGIGHPLGLSSKSSLDNRPWGRVIYAVEYGSRALPTTEMVHFGQTLYELKGLSWAKELPSILGIQLFFYYIIRDI